MASEEFLFLTPIWHWRSELSFVAAAQKCVELSNTTEGRIRSNRGGWQSDYIDFQDLPELDVVKQFAENCVRDLEKTAAESWGCPFTLSVEPSGSWINVNRKGDFNIPHIHPNTSFSFVCYLQAEEGSGNLVFHRSDLMEHYPIDTFDSMLYAKSANVSVTTGLGIMFPAWLKHEVTEHKLDTPRVSIAFNVKQI